MSFKDDAPVELSRRRMTIDSFWPSSYSIAIPFEQRPPAPHRR